MTDNEKQLAKAKSHFLALCESVDLCAPILRGERSGHRNCWASIEREMHRGKEFFKTVKGIGDLFRESLKEESEQDDGSRNKTGGTS